MVMYCSKVQLSFSFCHIAIKENQVYLAVCGADQALTPPHLGELQVKDVAGHWCNDSG